MRRSWFIAFGRELLFFALFLAAAIALTWPLAAQLQTLVSDTGDPLLNTWIIDWDHYAMTHRGVSLFQANIFYPGKYPLAYSENMLGIAVVMLPAYLAGLPPLVTYNVAMLLGFAFSAYGAFILGRKATGSAVAGIVAGLLYGFVPFRIDHLAHIQIVWGGWLPMIFAALLHFRQRPTYPRAAALWAALLMNGMTNIHWLLFGMFAFVASVILIAIARAVPRGCERQFWIRLALATVTATALLYPLLRPYKIVSKLYEMRRWPEEVMELSADWTDWLVATDRNAMYGALAPWKIGHPERHLFPGLVVVLLTAAAFFLTRERPREESPPPFKWKVNALWLHALDAAVVVGVAFSYIGAISEKWEWRINGHRLLTLTSSATPAVYLLAVVIVRLTLALPSGIARYRGENLGDRIRASRFPLALWIAFLCIAIGIVGSFGLNAFFHTFLFRHFEAFRSIRAVARWSAIAYLGLSLAAAFGVTALMRCQSPRLRQLVAILLVLLAANDVRTNIVWGHAIADIPPVTTWLKQPAVPAPIVELPLEAEWAQFYYLYWATAHHKLSMNGVSGFEPPVHARMTRLTRAASISSELMDILIAQHCAIVVVHADQMGDQMPKYLAWLKNELQAGRLIFLRRFDHGAEGDWAFAVRGVAAGSSALRAPETADSAGFTPSKNLERLLAGQTSYNGISFGRLDIAGTESGGTFRIVGWALSPYSVREAIARFECGKRQFRLQSVARGDVIAHWPWYPDTQPGFAATFARRPRGVRAFTDLQIEIVDGRGERTRLPSVWVKW